MITDSLKRWKLVLNIFENIEERCNTNKNSENYDLVEMVKNCEKKKLWKTLKLFKKFKIVEKGKTVKK